VGFFVNRILLDGTTTRNWHDFDCRDLDHRDLDHRDLDWRDLG